MNQFVSNCGTTICGNSIIVNGKRYDNIKGNNISVVNGLIKVDGKVINEGEAVSGEVTIKWEGDLANLESHNVDVLGDVKGNVNAHNVDVQGHVGGNVSGHNIECGNVMGSVTGRNISHG